MKDPADYLTPELPLELDPAADARAGMAWWNALTEVERLQALETAETGDPAVAWERYKTRLALREIDETMQVLGRVREAWARHFG